MKSNKSSGIYRIDKDVYQISIPHLTNRIVNVYAITGKGLTLVDSGHSHESSVSFLENAIHSIGYSLDDIRQIIYTHTHSEHVGGGLILGKSHDMVHIACHGTDDQFRDHESACSDFISEAENIYRKYCLKPDLFKKNENMAFFREYIHYYGDSSITIDRFVSDGDKIIAGDMELRVIHTPSHTPWDICLYEPYKKFLFSGDFIAENGISLLGNVTRSDAGSYLNSLNRVLKMDIDLILPSHGSMIQDAREIIMKSIDITKAREKKILDLLQTGKKTVCEIAETLLGKENESLAPIIYFRYLGMVITYLKKLEQEGRIIKTPSETFMSII